MDSTPTLLGAGRIGLRKPHKITISDLARIDLCDHISPAKFTVDGAAGMEVVLSAVERRVDAGQVIQHPVSIAGQIWTVRADKQGIHVAPSDAAVAQKQTLMLHLLAGDEAPVFAGRAPAGSPALWTWEQACAGRPLTKWLQPGWFVDSRLTPTGQEVDHGAIRKQADNTADHRSAQYHLQDAAGTMGACKGGEEPVAGTPCLHHVQLRQLRRSRSPCSTRPVRPPHR